MFESYRLSYNINELSDRAQEDHGSKEVGACHVPSQSGQLLPAWYKLWPDNDIQNGVPHVDSLKKMITWARSLPNDDILAQSASWPVAQIQTDQDITIGYLMAGLPNDPQKPWYTIDQLMRTHDHPSLQGSGYYTHPQKIARLGALLKVLNELHKQGIIVGDVNALNILTPGADPLLDAHNSPACYILDTDTFIVNGESIQTVTAQSIDDLPDGIQESTVAADLARFAVICGRSFFENPQEVYGCFAEPDRGLEQLIRRPLELEFLRKLARGESVSYEKLDWLADRWTQYETPQPHLESDSGRPLPWDSVESDVTAALGIASISNPSSPPTPPPAVEEPSQPFTQPPTPLPAPADYPITTNQVATPPVRRKVPTFIKVLICLIIIAMVFLGGRWAWPSISKIWSRPTPTQSQSQSPSPLPRVEPAIEPGDCLSSAPIDIWNGHPGTLDSNVVDCGSSNSHITVIDIRDTNTAPSDCDPSVGCLWFVQNGFTYLYNVIPQIGQCFYGYRNTAFPDAGTHQYNGYDLLLGDCGIAFPSRLDPDAIAQSLEVSVDQLEPTEFTIIELSDDALTCGDGQVGFMEQYSSAGETYVCATTKAAQI